MQTVRHEKVPEGGELYTTLTTHANGKVEITLHPRGRYLFWKHKGATSFPAVLYMWPNTMQRITELHKDAQG